MFHCNSLLLLFECYNVTLTVSNVLILTVAVFQVFDGYVDDCKNTDNAWVETTVLNIHLDQASQLMVDINMVRTALF